MNYTIKQLILDDDENLGIHAISLVDDPAIEENFLFFNKEVKTELLLETPGGAYVRDFYQYTAQPEPEVIDTSHDFCRQKAGHVYHMSEIQTWGKLGNSKKEEYGFILENDFFTKFNGNVGSYNINQQIYNCRHWFRRVNSINEIPEYKRKMNFSKQEKDKLNIKFEISNKEKREIQGLALKSNQFIYRNDIEGKPGYVYFTRETIRKLKDKYGYNRKLTIQHMEDITGTAILLDSWLDEDDDNNITKWFLKYKIIDDKLWDVIKKGLVRGFSIEAILNFK